MIKKVQFAELTEVLFETGLTINSMAKLTGVSRNTLTLMRDGKEVSRNSVIKLLKKLHAADHDIRKFRTAFEHRMTSVDTQLRKTAGAQVKLVGGTDIIPRRNARRVAADLSEQMELCAELSAELAKILKGPDAQINDEDALNLSRNYKRLNADFDFINHYLELPKLNR